MNPTTGKAWTARVFAPLLLVGLAAALLASGDFAPRWMMRVGALASIGELASIRFAAGVIGAFALSAVLVAKWSNGLARAGLAFAGLAGLATVSGSVSGPVATLLAGLVAVVGCATLFLALRGATARAVQRGPSDGWRTIAVVALTSFSLGAAASLPARAPSPANGVAPGGEALRSTPGAVDFMINRWEGKSLDATGLFEHLPALRSLVGSGVTYLVFYSPRCGHCHQFFEEHFSGVLSAQVIAIKIPVLADEMLLPSDQPEDITCPECVRLELPVGPLWVVTPPTVVRVEDGIVRCANEPPARKNCVDG